MQIFRGGGRNRVHLTFFSFLSGGDRANALLLRFWLICHLFFVNRHLPSKSIFTRSKVVSLCSFIYQLVLKRNAFLYFVFLRSKFSHETVRFWNNATFRFNASRNLSQLRLYLFTHGFLSLFTFDSGRFYTPTPFHPWLPRRKWPSRPGFARLCPWCGAGPSPRRSQRRGPRWPGPACWRISSTER